MQVKFLEHEIASYIVFQKIILMVSAEIERFCFRLVLYVLVVVSFRYRFVCIPWLL